MPSNQSLFLQEVVYAVKEFFAPKHTRVSRAKLQALAADEEPEIPAPISPRSEQPGKFVKMVTHQ